MGRVRGLCKVILLGGFLAAVGCTPKFDSHTAALSYDLQRMDPGLGCFAKGKTKAGAALPTFGALKWLVTGQMSAASFENPDLAQKVMANGTATQKRDRFLAYVLSVSDDLTEAKQMVRKSAAIEYACSTRLIDSNLVEIRKAQSKPPSHRYYWGGRHRSNQETIAKFQSLDAANKETRRLVAALYRNILAELDAASESHGPASVRAGSYKQPQPPTIALQGKSTPQRQRRETEFDHFWRQDEFWRQKEAGLFA